MTIERRATMVAPELRAEGEKRTLKGYAAVFDSPADIGGCWIERVAPGAFAKAINGDVRALVDHDHGRVIGRTTSGTLRLQEDERGLAVEIDLPDTTDGRDLRELVSRGDITGMSFGFSVTHDEWDETQEPAVRTIHEVRLYEVSAVAFPAYAATEIALRSSSDLADKRKAEDERKAREAEQARKGYDRRKKLRAYETPARGRK